MPLTTGTGLTNASDVIDAFRTHLLADGVTSVVNDGTVGANNKEVWVNIPQASTFNNDYDITFGIRAASSDLIELTASFLTPTQALLTPPGSPATRNTFLRVLGQCTRLYTAVDQTQDAAGNDGDVYPNFTKNNNTNGNPVGCDRFNQGGTPYLSHWIFSPNNSPLGSTQYYCYMVVEVTTGVYRTFGFGELIKLGTTGWQGGLFVEGSKVRASQAVRSRYFCACDTDYNGFGHGDEEAYVLNLASASYNRSSPNIWNPWMWGGTPWTNDWQTVFGMGPRAFGEDFIERGQAAFSGEVMRVPSRVYAMDTYVGQTSPWNNRMRPLGEHPEVFHTHVGSYNPGDTIQDDVDKFLVVPYTSKTGTDNSGNFGFLIRHPDL